MSKAVGSIPSTTHARTHAHTYTKYIQTQEVQTQLWINVSRMPYTFYVSLQGEILWITKHKFWSFWNPTIRQDMTLTGELPPGSWGSHTGWEQPGCSASLCPRSVEDSSITGDLLYPTYDKTSDPLTLPTRMWTVFTKVDFRVLLIILNSSKPFPKGLACVHQRPWLH